jgi:hypothetical protein
MPGAEQPAQDRDPHEGELRHDTGQGEQGAALNRQPRPEAQRQ